MTDWPRVDIIVVTYDRIDEFSGTVKALTDKIDYPQAKLRILVADDFSPGDYLDRLWRRALRYPQEVGIKCETVPADQNVGWGANVNRALRYSDAPYILQIEDDYILRKDLDLCAAVACMEVVSHIGMLRFRGTAGDYLVYHQQEANISKWLPDYQDGVGLPGRLSYLLIDGGSPGLYLYSHGLHLKRANFHNFYGQYPEGLRLGHTEESYAHTVKDKMRANPYAPVLCIQPAWIPLWLDHIGKSYQLGPLDIERTTV